MDPITASALAGTLTTLLNGVAGEAGKSAWASLTVATKRLLGRDAPALDAAGPEDAEAVAGRLVEAAADAPEFAEFLQQWHATTSADIQIATSGGVNNSVSGNAHVGKLIQAHTVGDVTF